MFHLSLLEFCTTVLPFEPQGSQKVEDEPPYPSIRVKAYWYKNVVMLGCICKVHL